MRIRRQRGQPGILDGPADGEVIEVLERDSVQAEQVVEGVVEVAADAGPADAGGLGFQVEDLAEDAGLPEEVAIPPGASVPDRAAEVSDHPQAEGAVGGDLLMAA